MKKGAGKKLLPKFVMGKRQIIISLIILIILIILVFTGILNSFISTNLLSGRAGSNETNYTSEPCVDTCPSEVCVDDCDYSGQKICSGKYAKTCGYYDSDSCLDINKGTYCSYGCYAGSCSAKTNQTNQTQTTSNQTNTSTNSANISNNQANEDETEIESNETDYLIDETISENETNQTEYEIIISNDTNYTLEDSNDSNFTISVDNNTINVSITPNATSAKISIEQALSNAVYIEKVEKIVLSLEPGGLVYLVSGKREGKLLGIIHVSATIKQKIDANSGNLISTKKPWWSFLATNI